MAPVYESILGSLAYSKQMSPCQFGPARFINRFAECKNVLFFLYNEECYGGTIP